MQVNVLQAKTDFSKLVHLVESGREKSVVIARNGHPVAKIVPVEVPDVSKRIGIAEGIICAPDDFDANNDEAIAMLMEGTL